MLPKGSRTVWIAASLFALSILLGNPNYQWHTERTSPFGADFVQEWVAGDMLLSGAAEHIYDRAAFQQWQHDADRLGFEWPQSQYYPAVYPPPYYCVTAPLACLPYRVAAIAWLCLLVAAYAASASLTMRTYANSTNMASTRGAPSLTRGVVIGATPILWCLGLLLPAMFFGCVLGQKGSLWLLVVSSSVYLLTQNRPVAAGCVAALLTLKPTLCGLLPLAMLLTGQWRFCLGFCSASVAIYGGSALCLPYSMWSDYLQVVRGATEYQGNSGYRSGWSTSLMTLLTAAGAPKLLGVAAMGASLLALMGRCVLMACRSTDRNPMTNPECLWLLLIGTAILSPHAYFYDLTWLMLPLSGMVGTQPRRAIRNLAVLWIGMLLGQTFELGPAFPAMALLILLLIDKPHLSGRG